MKLKYLLHPSWIWAYLNHDKRINKIKGYIARHSRNKEPNQFNYIQVGSFDGVTNDPFQITLKHWKWNSILMEPLKYFEKLKKNYKGYKNVKCLNMALFDVTGTSVMWFPLNPTKPYQHQLGSFLPRHAHKHGVASSEVTVKTITYNDLIKKYKLNHIDLMHIDAEGYDHALIEQISRSWLKPDMIMYEHVHHTREQNKKCKELLWQYDTIKLWDSTFCYRKLSGSENT